MPNIMLTYRCNLKCPYCFANEFVNKSSADITIENFDRAVEFLTRNGEIHLGLIGGEPTLHPQFSLILDRIIENPKISEATVYTNGVLLDRFVDRLIDPKFRILVNCNAPQTIGEENYARIVRNLDVLISDHQLKQRINLGINLYSDDLDYTFIVELLKRYELHRVRVSLTVPDFSVEKKVDSLQSFRSRKAFLLSFLRCMDENQILPYYDCNKPPYCIWNEEERAWLEQYVKKYRVSESNLIGHRSICYPVIDILPDLRAVRCFGMSEFDKVPISDFRSVTDLASYFLRRVDSYCYQISACSDCRDCYEQKTRNCTSGCIGFKGESIKMAQDYTERL